MMIKKICKNCKYIVSHSYIMRHFCFRFPAVGNLRAEVRLEDWCGEFTLSPPPAQDTQLNIPGTEESDSSA